MKKMFEAAHSSYNRVKDREEQRFRDEELASESQGDGDDGRAAGGGISIGGISSDAYDGYSPPTPSDMSISDNEDGDEQQQKDVSDLRLMRTVTPRGSSDDDSSGAMDIQPSAQAQCNIFTRTSGPSLVSGRVMPGPSSGGIIRPNTKQWLMECVAVAAEAAKAETQPQREGSSIAPPQRRKKRKQAKSADLADWFEAS